MNNADIERTHFTAKYSRLVLIILSLLSIFTLTSCFTSNSTPATPVSAKISDKNESVDGNPDVPVLNVKYTVKQLHFSWSAVAKATSYRILENPDGISGFSPISPYIPTTSYAHEIILRSKGWIKASYQLEACNSSLKCSTSSVIEIKQRILSGIAPIDASNRGLNDYFGTAVTMSEDGTTLVVGAPGEDSSATGINGDENSDKQPQSGAAYVFEYRGGKWTQHSYLKASNSTRNSRFGNSLTLSDDGNTLAIGAAGGDGGGSEQSGAVYIFTRTNNQWHEQDLLRAANAETGDLFGISVDLSGDGTTLAIGAPGEDSGKVGTGSDNSIIDSGAAYIWSLNGGQWLQQRYIKPDTITRLGGFGRTATLSADGNTLAVGANKGASTNHNGEGAVFTFSYQRDGSQWNNQQLIKAPYPAMESSFGASIVLSNDGNTLAAGSPQENSNNGEHTGAVYLFTRNQSGQWMKQGDLKASNAGAYDEFGTSLAFNENASLLAVGAPFEDSMATGLNGDQTRDELHNPGSAYLFALTDKQWKQIAYIKPTKNSNNNERLFGEFGTSIALSSDSSTLVVGAPHLASRLLLTGKISETLNAPHGNGVVYLHSPPGMLN